MTRKKQPESKSKSEELKDAVAESVDFKRKHTDPEQIQLRADFLRIFRSGTERELIQALQKLGKGEDTREGQEIISQFRKLRGYL